MLTIHKRYKIMEENVGKSGASLDAKETQERVVNKVNALAGEYIDTLSDIIEWVGCLAYINEDSEYEEPEGKLKVLSDLSWIRQYLRQLRDLVNE